MISAWELSNLLLSTLRWLSPIGQADSKADDQEEIGKLDEATESPLLMLPHPSPTYLSMSSWDLPILGKIILDMIRSSMFVLVSKVIICTAWRHDPHGGIGILSTSLCVPDFSLIYSKYEDLQCSAILRTIMDQSIHQSQVIKCCEMAVVF